MQYFFAMEKKSDKTVKKKVNKSKPSRIVSCFSCMGPKEESSDSETETTSIAEGVQEECTQNEPVKTGVLAVAIIEMVSIPDPYIDSLQKTEKFEEKNEDVTKTVQETENKSENMTEKEPEHTETTDEDIAQKTSDTEIDICSQETTKGCIPSKDCDSFKNQKAMSTNQNVNESEFGKRKSYTQSGSNIDQQPELSDESSDIYDSITGQSTGIYQENKKNQHQDDESDSKE